MYKCTTYDLRKAGRDSNAVYLRKKARTTKRDLFHTPYGLDELVDDGDVLLGAGIGRGGVTGVVGVLVATFDGIHGGGPELLYPLVTCLLPDETAGTGEEGVEYLVPNRLRVTHATIKI